MNPHPTHLHDISALKSALISQLPRVVEWLFPARVIHRTAHEYRIGARGSISLRLADGSYFNHETGEGGDVFALIQHTLRTDFKGVLVWVRGFVGHATPSPSAPPRTPVHRKSDDHAARQRDKALAMWKRSAPIAGTLAEAYLRERRGIAVERLPSSLRFIAHAYNYTAGGFYPAMIAAVSAVDAVGCAASTGEPGHADSNIIAAHCTFLDPETGDKLRGDGIKPRLIFGACRGGAMHLAPATERLALCEGIEDALSIMPYAPDWPVWATGGTSGLRSVQLPPTVREVMLCADRDAAGMQAARDVSARLIGEGRTVRIATPPEPHKDFNAALLAEAHHVE